MRYQMNEERKNINNENVMNEEKKIRDDARLWDYYNGKTDNEFVRWLGQQGDMTEKPIPMTLLLPKWPILHPNKYDEYWDGSQEEIRNDEDGYYEFRFFRQLEQSEGNDKYNIMLLNGGDMWIPIRLYSRGGAEVDPDFRVHFNRRFSKEERHFIMGCILKNESKLSFTNRDYCNNPFITQSYFSKYRDDMSPKRLRTGDIRNYDYKSRRKIKREATGPYSQVAMNMNITYNSFENN